MDAKGENSFPKKRERVFNILIPFSFNLRLMRPSKLLSDVRQDLKITTFMDRSHEEKTVIISR